MGKRVSNPVAIKAIRAVRAESDPQFRGSAFAITCQMSHAHLCNIEAGRKRPTEEVLYRIAAHLRVPVDAISYVIEESPARPSPNTPRQLHNMGKKVRTQ